MTTSLEQQLEQSFTELEISREQQDSLKTYLGLLRDKDEPTYEHCVRVGLKGIEVARFIHIVEPKALYYPGLLHDVGKYFTDSKSLKKVEGFDENDVRELQRHPLEGYRLLKDIHPFSARVLLMHHCFQGERSYPKCLPELIPGWTREQEVATSQLVFEA